MVAYFVVSGYDSVSLRDVFRAFSSIRTFRSTGLQNLLTSWSRFFAVETSGLPPSLPRAPPYPPPPALAAPCAFNWKLITAAECAWSEMKIRRREQLFFEQSHRRWGGGEEESGRGRGEEALSTGQTEGVQKATEGNWVYNDAWKIMCLNRLLYFVNSSWCRL